MTTTRIAINGFGRIGRTLFRLLQNEPAFTLVAINDLYDAKDLTYLTRFDSVMGPLPFDLSLDGTTLKSPKESTEFLAIRDPETLPWKALNVDVVLECSGVFRTRDQLSKHLKAGAKKVLLSVPPKDELDATVVYGVNEDTIKPDDRLISNASCTTNALAPILNVLQNALGIESGFMTTVHAYTNDQKLKDTVHKKDPRRGRAAAHNIIPTTTGAAKAVAKIIPALTGKMDGMAVRVPVIDGSMIDLNVRTEKPSSAEAVNTLMREAAEGPLKHILKYEPHPLVSRDILGNPHSSVLDASLTQAIGDRWFHMVSWYDNEYGYSNRMIDILKKMVA